MFEREIKVKGEYVKGTIKNKRFHGNVEITSSRQIIGGLNAGQVDNIIAELVKVRDELVKGMI